ncbi:unnamed protein product [Urochloa decumbens]|uniref:Uncharacterized protein n=1 Tax=Urochloa decumbens TaxID=240449 RepID=A0ABC9B9H0_9POAL
MATFYRKNLVIFEDTEVNYNDAATTGLIVLVRPRSPQVLMDITHGQIMEALQQQAAVNVPIRQISRYLCDYVVGTTNFRDTSKILRNGILEVGQHRLAILPLMPGYGSSEVHIDATFPSYRLEQETQEEMPAYQPPEALKLIVTGVPPVFWERPELIPRIFRNICEVCQVCINRNDLAFSMLTYASPSHIPKDASVGIRRVGPSNAYSILNIWPIWIDVVPATPSEIEAVVPNEQGDDGAGSSRGGGPLGAGHQRGYLVEAPEEPVDSSTTSEAPVDSSNDSSMLTLPESGTEIPETPYEEITSRLSIER